MPRNPNKIDYSNGFPEGFQAFSMLEDPRSGGNTKHHFGAIILMAYTCVLCGVENYEHMEEFCDANEEWFSTWLPLPNGTPCYNTFSRVIEAIEPDCFANCIVAHLDSIGKEQHDKHVAIDGKSLRGSGNKQDKRIHAVSAWACEKGLTLAQTFTSDKSNEITAIPILLEMLNLEGSVVTIDAMGAQQEIAQKICDKGGDYLINVKLNQKTLHDEIVDQFEFAKRQLSGRAKKLNKANWSYTESYDQSRGRDEKRQTLICHNTEFLTEETKKKWASIGCLIMVCRHTSMEDGSIRGDVSFYMSSLKNPKPEDIHKYVRQHWHIENSCHWVLDTVFLEDSVQISNRNAAKNLSTMRKIALNSLKIAPEISRRKKPASLKKKQLRAAQSLSYRCISHDLI